MRCGRQEAYLNGVGALTRFADALYGPRFSCKALDRCVQLAFFYPILGMLLGWVLFDTHTPAGLQVFHADVSFGRRLVGAVLAITGLAVAIWIVWNSQTFANHCVARFLGPVDAGTAPPGFLAKVGRAAVGFLVRTAAFAGGVAVAVAVPSAFAFSGVVSVAFAFAAASAVDFYRGGAGAVARTGAVAVAVAFSVEDHGVISLVVFFYILLPITNAVLDWVSLAITRGFLDQTTDAQPTLALIGRSIFDLILATLCLIGLLSLLAGTLYAWEVIHPASLPISVDAYVAQIRANPQSGLPLYLMIATTLFPTFLHFGTALMALLAYPGRLLARPVEALKAAEAAGKTLRETQRIGIIRTVKWADTVRKVIPWLIALIMCGLYVVPIVALIPRAP